MMNLARMLDKIIGDDAGKAWRLAQIIEAGARESMGALLIQGMEWGKSDVADYDTCKEFRSCALEFLDAAFYKKIDADAWDELKGAK